VHRAYRAIDKAEGRLRALSKYTLWSGAEAEPSAYAAQALEVILESRL
jgi:hypothetical protein